MGGERQDFHFASRERPFDDVNGGRFALTCRDRDDNRAYGGAA